MKNKINILFISWDSAKTLYLENLFIPIFSDIQKSSAYRFYILQYTWATSDTLKLRQEIASKENIYYRAIKLNNNVLNKFLTTLTSSAIISELCKSAKIDYIMPRSIWPSFVTILSNFRLPIIYDADGLAYLEKREYNSSIFQTSIIYLIEKIIINRSQLVLTRTEYGIKWLQKNYKPSDNIHFDVILNGVSTQSFFFAPKLRKRIRNQLKLASSTILFIYIGSLGKKYALPEALTCFRSFYQKNSNSKFLILTPDINKANALLQSERDIESVIVKSVSHDKINGYLNAADFGFCFIKPSNAIKAVNPIKLNEYLLTGLPVIINPGIGETESWLLEDINCIYCDLQSPYLISHKNVHKLLKHNREYLSELSKKNCSLKAATSSYLSALAKLDTNRL